MVVFGSFLEMRRRRSEDLAPTLRSLVNKSQNQRAARRHDVATLQHCYVTTLSRFLRQNYKSKGDPIFEASSDVWTKSGT